jgi:hypothetical protein
MKEGITQLYHPIGGLGTFLKFIPKTPHGPKYVIKLLNGKEYFGPANEFVKIK